MIGMIKKYFESKAKTFELQIKESETLEKILQETADIVTERPTDGGWARTDQVTDQEKGHLQANQLEMLRKSRDFYRWDPFGRAAVQTMVNYIMGKGLNITPKADDPQVWLVWRDFWSSERNKMELKQFEIVTRLFRDGEVFIQFFDKDEDGRDTGKATIRLVDPLLIRNPGTTGERLPDNFNKTTTKAGIEHDADDIEKVIRYWVMSNADTAKFNDVMADDMLHIKIFSDSDQKRGESFIQPVMRLFRHYGQWLENRILLNKMRTAIVMIKEVSGTPAQVAQMAQTIGNMQNTRTGDTKKEQIRGGTVITANPGVKYNMQSPNINASDVKDDGREIKLNIAAGLNIPEYMFGDASNANFSSTLIAEAPFVKAVEYWQVVLEYWFKQLYKRVMERAVKGRVLTPPDDKEFMRRLKKVNDLQEQEGETEDGLTPREKELRDLMPEGKLETPSEIFFGCDMQWAEVVHRDIKAFVDSLTIARTNGWISDQSAAAAMGYDIVEETRKQKNIEEEARKTGNPLLNIKPESEEMDDDEDIDKEAQDIINNMTDEERKQILAKTSPQEIVDMIMAKAGMGNNGGQNGNNKTGTAQSQRGQ